jgi:hypothetical protein
MALSKQDQEFYEEKLGWKSFGLLVLVTALFGALMWPSLWFLQDWSAGRAGQWSSSIVYDLAIMGLMLGSATAVFMYLGFKFFLSMGWLPSRR